MKTKDVRPRHCKAVLIGAALSKRREMGRRFARDRAVRPLVYFVSSRTDMTTIGMPIPAGMSMIPAMSPMIASNLFMGQLLRQPLRLAIKFRIPAGRPFRPTGFNAIR